VKSESFVSLYSLCDRVFGGSGVVSVESSVIGWVVVAIASVGKAEVEGVGGRVCSKEYFRKPHNPKTPSRRKY
jgi:hypothetical protein